MESEFAAAYKQLIYLAGLAEPRVRLGDAVWRFSNWHARPWSHWLEHT